MNINPLLVQTLTSIFDAVIVIDANRRGAVIVVDNQNHLLGVVTDGDVRRAILAGLDLNQPVSTLLERRSRQFYPSPIIAPINMPDPERLSLMREYKIRHLPIVDEDNVVVDMLTLDDLLAAPLYGLTAVVMAGGFGRRLYPLTEDLPKPMLPIDGKPLLEQLIGQLREAGIDCVQVTTHYKPEHIKNYFGDGAKFGVKIGYVQEEQPLGTAGALGLLEPPDKPFLVVNGDILTRMDFKAMFAFHADLAAEMTVAVRGFTLEMPYGVVTVNGVDVTSVEEKPGINYFVNAGIYLLNPSALSFIPKEGCKFDMTDLINVLVNHQHRVVSFPIREYWMDVGRMDDYERAQGDVMSGRF
jgi:dTDP-glucose pyrophosphorylase/CBS domain-containing protein